MLNWLAAKFGLQVWIMEIILACAAGLGIYWYIKIREARAFDRGHANGIQENIKDQIGPLKEELELQRRELDEARKEVSADRANLSAERRTLAQLRTSIETEHTKQLQEIRSREAASGANIDRLSDAELVSAIKRQLTRNRAALITTGFDN